MASGDAAPLLEPEEGILHQMPQFVEAGIIVAGLPAVAARRDDHLHAARLCVLDNRISIAALAGRQAPGGQVFGQRSRR
jgi:hypothetical protein